MLQYRLQRCKPKSKSTYSIGLVRDKVRLEPDTVDINHIQLEHAELGRVPELVTELSVTLDIIDLQQDVLTWQIHLEL
jgi:hypothetical protein